MPQIEFDEATAETLEAAYRSRDAVRRRSLVREALAARPGEHILDVGCGLGFYVAELVDEVGDGGTVTGVDSSEEMLAFARRKTEGRDNTTLLVGDAGSLPVDDESFDAAISVQVFEYVQDLGRALGELRRALRPGGRAVLWDVDWSTLSWHSGDPDRMRRALAAWDEHLAHPALPRILGAQMRAAGFADIEVAGHVFATDFLDPESYAGILAPLIQGFIVERAGFDPEEAEAWAAEQRELDASGEFFFAVVQFCFTGRRPD